MLNVDAALDYLKRGWPVIPGHNPLPNGLCSCQRLNCDRPGKHPRIQWREFEHKLPSEAMVRNWWRRWPEASVIVLTGRLSGLLVVDIDPRSGGDENVHDLHLPETVTTLTGGGGEHYWFEYPASTEITIGANALPGIDWRGQGGYVVAPPSLHASGRTYEWEPGFGPDEHAFAKLPPAVVSLFLKHPTPSVLEGGASKGEIDLLAYIDGSERLRVGERNNMMARLAGHLLATGSSKAAALGTMLYVAQNAEVDAEHPAIQRDEVQATLDSIARAEARKRAAEEAIQGKVSLEMLETASAEDVAELARAAWADAGVEGVIGWVKLTGHEGVEYELELHDRVVGLGGSLLMQQHQIRSVVLNATGQLMPRLKAEQWEPKAALLARTAQEQRVSALRQSDRVNEWLDELLPTANDGETVEERRSLLATGPILYDGALAVRTRRLLLWLEANFGEKMDTRSLGRILTAAGWHYTPIRVSSQSNALMKVWVSPPLN